MKLRILLVVSSSWGEIDWVLPLLYYMKNIYNLEIYVYFRTDNLYKEHIFYKDLWQLLLALSHQIFWPSQIDQTLKSKISALKYYSIAPLSFLGFHNRTHNIFPHEAIFISRLKDIIGEIDVLFRAHDDLNFNVFYYYFSQAKIIIFPHSAYSHGQLLESNSYTPVQIETVPPRTLLLVTDESDQRFWVTKFLGGEPLIVGNPKLNLDWVAVLRNWQNQNSIAPRSFDKISAAIMAPKERNLIGKRLDLFIATIEMLTQNNIFINLKTHPRGRYNNIITILHTKANTKWQRSPFSAIGTALLSHFVFTFSPSTSCMDTAAAGTPTYEIIFTTDMVKGNIFRGKIPSSFWNEETQLTYSRLGITYPLRSREEILQLPQAGGLSLNYLRSLGAQQQRKMLAFNSLSPKKMAEILLQKIA